MRYIKELLGHSNISTTLVYTKISNRDMSKIKSLLDYYSIMLIANLFISIIASLFWGVLARF